MKSDSSEFSFDSSSDHIEDVYRALIESSPDAISFHSTDGIFIKASPRMVELLGYDNEDELIGRTVYDFISKEGVDRAKQSVSTTLAEQGRVENREYKILRRDGSYFIADGSASLVRDSFGQPRAVIAVIRDITRKKRLEEKLKSLNAELEDYAHTVSHDLSGPITNIIVAGKLACEILEDLPDCEQKQDMEQVLEAIKYQGKKAHEMTRDLLSLAEAGQIPYYVEDVSLSNVMSGITKAFSVGIEENNINVIVGDNLGNMRANPTQIYQLFASLFRNAVQHGKADEPVIEVVRLEFGEDGEHRFLFRDNGPGIPEGIIKDLFHPFVKSGYESTGVGLSIVEKIVKVYDGEIKAYNDNGACFEFLLKEPRG
ncbi:MAG: PAS domain-containing sensor histidine kinase [Actinobacteria bacterium]|nr:PAS domain-containing sensor histidine kinase [Actinomycetota bacterium]